MSVTVSQRLIQTDSIIANQAYTSDKTFAVMDPATDKWVANVCSVDTQGIELALESAQSAFEQLKAMNSQARSDLLMRWYQLVIANSEALAELMTLEQGKPLAEAKGEVAYGAEFIRWFAEEAKRSYGQVIPSNNHHQRLSTTKQPIGVVLGITPWNFPIAMVTRKVAPAIAAGCSFILKPSELTPLSALALAHLAIEAGFPSGAFNVVLTQDAPSVVEQLLSDERVKKVTFTGSTQIGKILLAQAAASVKRTSMELGGNAPFIVFESAMLSKAITGLVASKFRNAGQTCVATNRVLVAESIYSTFIAQLLPEVAKLKVGSGFDPMHQVGPLITASAKQRLIESVEQAIIQGGTFLSGQAEFERAKEQADNFFPVVVLGGITPQMAIYHQELFGPVVLLSTFEDERQALTMANETDYGLAAYFYSENINQIQRVSERLDFGMVGINEGLISNPIAPFGGVKQSGIGREGGQIGLDEYLQVKYLCLNIT
ncbi:succinate-semialdehyde dehydrogenase / glutarate-semialdehyde dehydrogenase [Pseudoalteromonas ulvae UL12]|uniref:NAD-dependent succinate-semialdehyde dehydrogenase n=1 Tax=Pseudoalteromonas ulvae TaxID=107327 RepID=UPI00186B9099|nr:NAD-dependent succinate-semialdehyde dehydrogenase [Pseudoalteromonas ulvae]MBE0363106.1 succinate-semialdehyde dehydrogenase / glutarate-semialdehyde dehydrogenase [Pseudoalteromonas ulvae UL12]